MAQTCAICGKKPQSGNKVSHANNKKRRRWQLNLKSIRAVVDNRVKRIRACTRCIRGGKIQKAA